MTNTQLPSGLENTPAQKPDTGPNWQRICWLPCELTLELPLVEFTVRDLLQLEKGSIVKTRWSRGAEVPLRANQQLIGWGKFEPLGDHIAVRVTELD